MVTGTPSRLPRPEGGGADGAVVRFMESNEGGAPGAEALGAELGGPLGGADGTEPISGAPPCGFVGAGAEAPGSRSFKPDAEGISMGAELVGAGAADGGPLGGPEGG